MDLGIKLSAISIILSIIFIFLFASMANKLGLVDTPCERKAHKGEVPLVGGMSVFFAFSLSIIVCLPHNNNIELLLIASSFMVFIGVLDDKYDLSVKTRIIGQFLTSSILIFGLDIYLENLGDFFFIGNINLGYIGIIITYLAIIGGINAFNMVDGIDGLLGSLAIISLSGIAYLSSDNNYIFYISIAGIAGLAVFLLFNIENKFFLQRKIFMGDAGSMFLGLLIVWLLIIGSQSVNGHESSFSPVMALYIIAIPLMDMIAIMFRRVRKGQSPFKPDREHMHHIFMRAGLSSNQALLFISIIAVLILLLGLMLQKLYVSEGVMFLIFLSFFIAYVLLIQNSWKVVRYIRSKLLEKTECK